MDELRLTVSGAARRLGIAPGTLRTWDRRYGIGPTDHVHGRHRRYSALDMARLEVMQRALVEGASPAEAARYALAAARPGPAPSAAPARTEAAAVRSPRRRPDPGAGIDVIASLGAPAPDWRGLAASLDHPLPAVPLVRGVGGLRMPDGGPAARGLARAALALDSTAVTRLVEESIRRDGLDRTWDEVVRPALDAVAARVRETGRGVEVARLLGESTALAFHIHAHAAPVAPPMRPVLLAGMPGDDQGVPLAALGALLAERRIAFRTLGPALPHTALVAAIRRIAPVAVVLWSQLVATADVAAVAAAALPATRPRFRTYVAGPGWDGAVLPRGVEWLASPPAAADRIGVTVLR